MMLIMGTAISRFYHEEYTCETGLRDIYMTMDGMSWCVLNGFTSYQKVLHKLVLSCAHAFF